MTIGEAIAAMDAVRPSAYSRETKIRWLSDLDGQIDAEILKTHEGTAEPFAGYDGQTPEDRALLTQKPYDKLYPAYLAAMVDYHNGEFSRHNNSLRKFEGAYQEYADWYNRTHLPVGKGIKQPV